VLPDTAPAVLRAAELPGRTWTGEPGLAVTIHAIEPRSFQRAREIREWLAARGVDRVTLAVVPAADLHPVGTRSPLLAAWLRSRAARGDAIAQHGLQHRGRGSEFAGLDPAESAGRVLTGLSLLREVELDPRGFIAPGYGYTAALRAELGRHFAWFGERAEVCGAQQRLRAPALGLGTASALARTFTPGLTRRRAARSGALLRLDIHPADFALPGHVAAFAEILRGAAGRQVLTYDDIFCLGA
jgi:predicted deacetylase